MSEQREYPPQLKWQSGILDVTRGVDKKGRPVTMIPDGKPIRLHFPFGDGRKLENGFGVSYMYAAELNGERHTLFANQRLHEALVGAGVGPMLTLEVTRTMTAWTTNDGQERTMAEFRAERIYTEDGGTEDSAVAALGGDVVGGNW